VYIGAALETRVGKSPRATALMSSCTRRGCQFAARRGAAGLDLSRRAYLAPARVLVLHLTLKLWQVRVVPEARVAQPRLALGIRLARAHRVARSAVPRSRARCREAPRPV
jgi:hypothetical protein